MFTFFVFICATTSPFIPQSCFLIEHQSFIAAFDGRTHNAIWVYEKLTRHSFEKAVAERSGMHYKIDESIPEQVRTTIEDYKDSGMDLGHLCPFSDFRGDAKAAADTFFLSNIVLQIPQLNRGHWMQLEKLIRNLANHYETLHVITMPLYLPTNGVMTYRVCGKNHVAIPTHFSKVIFAEKEDRIDVLAFILPNSAIPKKEPLNDFQTTLENVEHLAGVVFSYRPRIEFNK